MGFFWASTVEGSLLLGGAILPDSLLGTAKLGLCASFGTPLSLDLGSDCPTACSMCESSSVAILMPLIGPSSRDRPLSGAELAMSYRLLPSYSQVSSLPLGFMHSSKGRRTSLPSRAQGLFMTCDLIRHGFHVDAVHCGGFKSHVIAGMSRIPEALSSSFQVLDSLAWLP